jgi:ornithine carbamoyltransferase
MPVNLLIVRALMNFYTFFGDDFKVQCPTGTGPHMTLFEVAQELVRRLTGTFLRDADGLRPVYGGAARFQDDPHWRDLILF